MHAGVTNMQAAAQQPHQQLLPTLETTTSHTRELPCLTNEYSVCCQPRRLYYNAFAEQGEAWFRSGLKTVHKLFLEVRNMEEIAALIAIDWADRQHAICLYDVSSGAREHTVVKHTPAALQEWALSLRTRFAGKPIAVCLEQARGPLIYALLQYDFLVLYPINPATLAKYRQAFSPALGKDDPTDAEYLLDLLQHHRQRLQAWRPDDEMTRTLRLLVEHRRRLINDRTRISIG